MATKKKLLQAAAGVGGGGIDEPLGMYYFLDGNMNTRLEAITSDSSGNTLIGAQTLGRTAVSKLDTDFSVLWTKIFNDSSAETFGVTTDSSDNVYVVSHGNSGPIATAGDYDLGIYKLNSSGTYQSGISFGDGNEDKFTNQMNTLNINSDGQLSVDWNYEPSSVAATGAGAVGVLPSSLSTSNTIYRRYPNNSTIEELAISHTVLSDGDVVQIVRAARTESGGTRQKLLVTRYDADFSVSSNIVWQTTVDAGLTTSLDYSRTGCGADSDDNIYIGMNMTGQTVLAHNSVLIKLNSSGGLVWAKSATNDDRNDARSMSVASDGSIYLHVESEDSATFTQVIQKWASDGTLEWAKDFCYQGATYPVLNNDINGDLLLGIDGSQNQGQGWAVYKLPSDGDKWTDVCGDLITLSTNRFSVTDETSNLNIVTQTGGAISAWNTGTSAVQSASNLADSTHSKTITEVSQTAKNFTSIKPVASFSNSRSGTTSNFTVSLPTTVVQENDIVVIAHARALANTAPTPSGWTLVGSAVQNDTYNTGVTVFYKRMGATPDTSVSLPNSNGNTSAAHIAYGYVFRGVDTTTALDVTYQTSTIQNSYLVTPASITPTTSGAMAVTFFAGAHNQGSEYYLRSDGFGHITPAGNDTWDVTGGACFKEWSGSGAVSFAQTITNGTDSTSFSGASVTIALRPA